MSPFEIYRSIQSSEPNSKDLEKIASVFYDPCLTRLGDIILTSNDFYHISDIYEFNKFHHLYK